MQTRQSWMIAGVIALTILVLTAGTMLISSVFFGPNRWMSGWFQITAGFSSNGEQIYKTGTSRTGPRITSRMEGMHGMANRRLACASCHGEYGEGGTFRMMMGVYEAPNIQYQVLTNEAHADEHEEHGPYTDETLKRAITEGLDADGQPLEWVMPRWNMTDAQLDDLIAYLKTIK
jgi:cytochrome c oxidase subunit II